MSKQRKIDKEDGNIDKTERNIKDDYYLKYRYNFFGLPLNEIDSGKNVKNKKRTIEPSSSSSYSYSSSSLSTTNQSLLPPPIQPQLERVSASSSLLSFTTYSNHQDVLLHNNNDILLRNERPLHDIGLSNLSIKELNLFYIYACKLCGTTSSEPLYTHNQQSSSSSSSSSSLSKTYDQYYKKLYDDLFIDKQQKYVLFMSKSKKQILDEMRLELSELLSAITQVYYF
jgi:hypothetical protein